MDTFLWILSKVLWHLVMPDKLLVLLLLIGTGLLWTRRQKLGRALVAGVTVVLVGVTVFPVGNWLVWTLEDRFPPVPEEALPARADGILVLGGAEEPRVAATRSQPALTGAAERLTAFVFLAQRYPQARLIFAGGSGALDEQDYKAADTARWVLTRLGMDPKRVLFENQSRNTLENAQYSYELAQPEPEETWILITSAWHMPRSVGVFRQLGWDVFPYPVDYNTTGDFLFDWQWGGLSSVGQVSWVLREWMGLVAYRILGRTSSLFPGPKN